MKFPIKDFFGKCHQIRRKLRIWSHLLKEPLMENFIFCVVLILNVQNYSLLKIFIIKKDLLALIKLIESSRIWT